jgi:hypothetical protein
VDISHQIKKLCISIAAYVTDPIYRERGIESLRNSVLLGPLPVVPGFFEQKVTVVVPIHLLHHVITISSSLFCHLYLLSRCIVNPDLSHVGDASGLPSA